jgi:hypothetical protein
MLLTEESARSFLNDPWTFGLLVTTLIGSLVTLAFSLGYNLQKLNSLTERQVKLEETNAKIFAKLDDLSRALPHQCQQVLQLSEIRQDIAALKEWRHGVEKQQLEG